MILCRSKEPHHLTYQYHGNGLTMNGYYQFASTDSLIIMVPSSDALSTDAIGFKGRLPADQCDRSVPFFPSIHKCAVLCMI
jgi:hypothetical protein